MASQSTVKGMFSAQAQPIAWLYFKDQSFWIGELKSMDGWARKPAIEVVSNDIRIKDE